MKKLLFALLVLLGVVTFTPQAEAGQYRKVWNGHCYTYVHKYRDDYCAPRHHTRYYHRPVRYYSQPVRYYRGYDRYDRYDSRRYYSSRPRISVSFGF
jgi:hypothetical protein